MSWGGWVAAAFAGTATCILVYALIVLPSRLDRRMRQTLTEFKQWADRDDLHIEHLNDIGARMADLPGGDSLDHLRFQRSRVKVEIGRIEDRGAFLNDGDDALEQRKYRELEEVEQRIDEHPERKQELEDTRSRLVARIEDIHRANEG